MPDKADQSLPPVTRRRGRRSGGALVRTVLLAALALAAALYWLGKDSPTVAADLQEYGLLSIAFVGLPILLAALIVGALRLWRKLRS